MYCSPSRSPALSSKSRRMNSPQSPCVLDEPRSAVVRLRASSVSCLVESAQGADEGFEFGDSCFGIALCLFDFFAELLDLITQWIEQSADFFLAAFGEGFGFLVEDVGGERGKLVGEGLLGGFEERDLFGQILALVFEVGFKLADARGIGAGGVVARLLLGAQKIALGVESFYRLFAFEGEGFESGACSGRGLSLRQLRLQQGKRFGGFAVALFEQGFLGFG